MKQLSTPEKCNQCFEASMNTKKHNVNIQPSKQTLNLIMQFARTYHVEKKLPSELSGILLN